MTTTQNENGARTTLDLPPDHMNRVREIARAQNRKTAQQFRAIIAEYLATHGDDGKPLAS